MEKAIPIVEDVGSYYVLRKYIMKKDPVLSKDVANIAIASAAYEFAGKAMWVENTKMINSPELQAFLGKALAISVGDYGLRKARGMETNITKSLMVGAETGGISTAVDMIQQRVGFHPSL